MELTSLLGLLFFDYVDSKASWSNNEKAMERVLNTLETGVIRYGMRFANSKC